MLSFQNYSNCDNAGNKAKLILKPHQRQWLYKRRTQTKSSFKQSDRIFANPMRSIESDLYNKKGDLLLLQYPFKNIMFSNAVLHMSRC